MDDLLNDQNEEQVKYVAYTDYLALMIEAPSRQTLEKTFQAQTEKLTTWANTAKLKFCA